MSREEILNSIISEIGDLLGVQSIDGQEYVSAVKALMRGQKMPYYQIMEERWRSINQELFDIESFILDEGMWEKYMAYKGRRYS
jgi:hypothetical protein